MNIEVTEWGKIFDWTPLAQYEKDIEGKRVYLESDRDYQPMLDRQISLIADLQVLLFSHFGVDDEFDSRNEAVGACVSDNLYPTARVTAYLLASRFSVSLLREIQRLAFRFTEFEIDFGLESPQADHDFVAHLTISSQRLVASVTETGLTRRR